MIIDKMPMTRAEVADHLDAAADVIMTRGLARGRWVSDDGEVCPNEALLIAMGATTQATGPLADQLTTVLPRSADSVRMVCPQTARAYGVYLLAHHRDEIDAVVHNDDDLDLDIILNDPARFIIKVDDNTQIDMAEAMRRCAKHLREIDGRVPPPLGDTDGPETA